MNKHVVVEALAGTGKTTTLVTGMKLWLKPGGKPKFSPSPQQEAIWETLQELPRPKTVLFCAFNKSIEEELKKRVPTGCVASTIHSLGSKALRNTYGYLRLNNNWKTDNLIEILVEKDIREYRRYEPGKYFALKKAYDMARLSLLGFEMDSWYPDGITMEQFMEVINKYEIDCDGQEDEILDMVKQLLDMGSDLSDRKEIDFTDMIWLPTVLGARIDRYDAVFVDEAQDLNACQQELVLKAAKSNVVACGDVNQAIYGFAGADTDSIPNLVGRLEELGGVTRLPLTVTYRCGREIVEVARQVVPEYEAHFTNSEGRVETIGIDVMMDFSGDFRTDPANSGQRAKLLERIPQDGDMVLCRVNAPLVSTVFKFLSNGRKANIIGRDVAATLKSFIKKMKAEDPGELLSKAQDFTEKELQKLSKQKFLNDAKMISLQDRLECVEVFCEGCQTIDEIFEKIDQIFSDQSCTGVRFSSIHRAKGLESDRVFILYPELLPHPMAKTPWQQQQEHNLKYVAITRAINTLYFVRG